MELPHRLQLRPRAGRFILQTHIDNMIMKRILFLLPILMTVTAQAQLRNDDVWELPEMRKSAEREVVRIPDVGGFLTLKCDFHIHTVFSDGLVWPAVRVEEAWMQGLDAIAITDHIEYRPRKDILKGDLNESYKIAKKRGDEIGLIVIQGTEITRKKPLGHLNALFINDANPLAVQDSSKAIDIAREQGAVIMWNHPGWPDDKSTLYDVHEKLLAEKKIDLYEVHNHMEYYPLTFDWMNRYGIAPAANSDTHNSIGVEYGMEKLSRPLTLVFAREKSIDGIKDALKERRTAALFNGMIVATEEWATKLFWECVKYRIVSYNEKSATVEVENVSDIPFVVRKANGNLVSIPAGKAIRSSFNYPATLTVMNVFTGHGKNLELKVSD